MTKVRVGSKSDFTNVDRRLFDVGGTEVGVFRLDTGLVAYENRCPHQGGPVLQGRVLGKVDEIIDSAGRSQGMTFCANSIQVACPWHAYEFDLRTGEHQGDRKVRLRPIEVTEEGEDVYLII